MLRVEVREGCAWMTLDRPERLNALTPALWVQLSEELAAIEADAEVRSVVLHGAGRCFSAGGDIGELATVPDLGERRERLRDAVRAVRALAELSKPTVAAVHGHCLGGGLELTLACDVVVCDETSSFATPEARVGLVPAILLAHGRGLSPHWLRYLALGGEAIGAEEARLAGLVNFVVPAGEHLDRAGAVAARLAAAAPLAQALVKGALAGAGGGRLEEAVEHGAMLQGSEDFAEGAAAFRERRPPRFRSR